MIPALSREQVRRVDRLAIERYGMVGLVLMENAGRGAADIIRTTYGRSGTALICCGPGNNGGDGCVIARHLHNAGWTVRLLVTGDESRMSPDMLANFRIVQAMKLETVIATDEHTQRSALASIASSDVVVDALFGTGFQGDLRSPTSELIDAINAAKKRATVAIDVPSGLDCDTGQPANAAIRADLTVTFVALKVGFSAPTATPHLGSVEVVGIGAPASLIAEVTDQPA